MYHLQKLSVNRYLSAVCTALSPFTTLTGIVTYLERKIGKADQYYFAEKGHTTKHLMRWLGGAGSKWSFPKCIVMFVGEDENLKLGPISADGFDWRRKRIYRIGKNNTSH